MYLLVGGDNKISFRVANMHYIPFKKPVYPMHIMIVQIGPWIGLF